jgi:hypothetical protein
LEDAGYFVLAWHYATPLAQFVEAHSDIFTPVNYVQPDFMYGDRIVVFCDGTPHDRPEVIEDDRHKREVLEDAGYFVLAWHYATPLAQFVEAHSDIFTPVN